MIGELSGLGSAAAWALVSTVMRSVSNRVNPVVVNGLRCIYAASFLLIISVALDRTHLLLALSPMGLAMLMISGLVGQGLGDAMFIMSMKLIGAARAMPISSTQPLLTMTLAVVFLGERVTWLAALGTLLVLAGVYLLAFPYGPLARFGQIFKGADRRGVAMSLGAAACWAVSAVCLKIALETVDTLSANMVRMVVASILLFGYGTVTSGRKVLAGADRRTLLIMALAGLLGTASSMGYITAVSYAGAAKSAVLASTSPFFALPLSLIFLKERINSRILTGSALCVVGIWLVLLG